MATSSPTHSKAALKEGMQASAKAVEAFRLSRKSELDNFLATMGQRVTHVTQLRDEAVEAKMKHSATAADRNQSYLSSVIYSSKFGKSASFIQGAADNEVGDALPPAVGSAAEGEAAEERSPKSGPSDPVVPQGKPAEAPLQNIEVRPLGTFDASVVENFPNNETLLFHYSRLQQEAYIVSGILTNIRIYVSLNLPAIQEWSTPAVTKMMQCIEIVEEANEKEVQLYDTALMRYLSARRDLEQRAYDLPLASVAQFIAAMESDAWDQLEILFRSFIDTLVNLNATLTSLQDRLEYKKGKASGSLLS